MNNNSEDEDFIQEFEKDQLKTESDTSEIAALVEPKQFKDFKLTK